MSNEDEFKRRFDVVVVWERKQPSTSSWQPYSAEISCLIERSFQKDLTSVHLSDALHGVSEQCRQQQDQQSKVIHFGCLLEKLTDESRHGVPVRRSVYAADSCVGQGISWQWFDDHTNRWHFYNVDVQDQIEKANKRAETGIDLSKSFDLPYVVDLFKMIQKRKVTGTRRPIRRVVDRPYPSVQVSPSSETGSAKRRSERISKQTSLLPINEPNLKAVAQPPSSSEFSLVSHSGDSQNLMRTRSKKAGPGLSISHAAARSSETHVDRESVEDSHGSLSSMFFSLFKRPLSRSVSSPAVKASSDQHPSIKGCHSGEELMTGMAPRLKQNSKRATFRNPCVVSPGSPTRQDGVSIDEFLRKYSTSVTDPPDENCPICCVNLRLPSSYDDDGDDTTSGSLALKRCEHVFHVACINAMLDSQSSVTHVQCPTCKVIHGRKIGNQPPGKMTYYFAKQTLPGYDGFGTICIIYDFRDGIQDESHPAPREHYSARTFPRTCYLPDDEIGRKVLRLLIVAWQRRLIFTIGSSVTTGQQNVITWNEIHHKTEFGSNYTGHGYPDPNYLKNVLLELAAQGVFEDDDDCE